MKKIILLLAICLSLFSLTDEQMRIVAKSHKGYTLSGYEKGVFETIPEKEISEYKTKLDNDKKAQLEARKAAFEQDPNNIKPVADDNSPKGNLPTDESSTKNSGKMVSSGAKLAAVGVASIPLALVTGDITDVPKNLAGSAVAIGSGIALMGKGAFDGVANGIKSLFKSNDIAEANSTK